MVKDILQSNDDMEKIAYTSKHPYETDRYHVHKLLLDFIKFHGQKLDVVIHRIDGGFIATIDIDYYAIVAIENIVRINVRDLDVSNGETKVSRFFNINLKTGVICTNVEAWPGELLHLTNDIYRTLGIV